MSWELYKVARCLDKKEEKSSCHVAPCALKRMRMGVLKFRL